MSDIGSQPTIPEEAPAAGASQPKALSERRLATLVKARAKKAEAMNKARVEKREAMLNNISEDYRAEVDHLVKERLAIEKERLEKEFANWKLGFYESRGQATTPASATETKLKKAKKPPPKKKVVRREPVSEDEEDIDSDETYAPPMKRATRKPAPPPATRPPTAAPTQMRFPTLLGH